MRKEEERNTDSVTTLESRNQFSWSQPASRDMEINRSFVRSFVSSLLLGLRSVSYIAYTIRRIRDTPVCVWEFKMKIYVRFFTRVCISAWRSAVYGIYSWYGTNVNGDWIRQVDKTLPTQGNKILSRNLSFNDSTCSIWDGLGEPYTVRSYAYLIPEPNIRAYFIRQEAYQPGDIRSYRIRYGAEP